VIEAKSSGSFDKTEFFINNLKQGKPFDILSQYGQKGVDLLVKATPVDSGLTASDWYYKVIKRRGKYTINWYNSNKTSEGTSVVVLLHYGHATGGGGYVEGLDFINPALRPLFDKIANDVWREVKQ